MFRTVSYLSESFLSKEPFDMKRVLLPIRDSPRWLYCLGKSQEMKGPDF